MNLVYANALLIIMVLLELVILGWFRKQSIPWREVIFNLNSGHVMLWVLRGVELATYHFVYTNWSIHLFKHWHPILVWGLAFVAWDFCFYWLHRMHHKFHLLWAVHVVHHEGEHFSLSLGIRNSWYSSITSIPFFILMALAGVSTEIFLIISSTHYFIQFYNHNQVVRNSGWLNHIFITPTHHMVHHGKNDLYVDKNFGGTLVFWDKLFGTFQALDKNHPIEFGTHDHLKTENVVLANNVPFFKIFMNFKPNGKVKYDRIIISEFWIATAGLGLFGLLLCYINIEQVWSIDEKFSLFLITFLGTVACGGLSEGKRWGIFLWVGIFMVLAPTLFLSLNWDLLVLKILIIALGLHGCLMGLIYLRKLVFVKGLSFQNSEPVSQSDSI